MPIMHFQERNPSRESLDISKSQNAIPQTPPYIADRQNETLSEHLTPSLPSPLFP